MKINSRLCAPVLATLFGFLLTVVAQDQYRTYRNSRFTYSISYPANLLYPQGESANGDGQRFLSKDGRAELIVWGSNNALNEKLRDVYERETSAGAGHPKRIVTYKILQPGWFVVSGSEAGRIFYQKTMLKGDVFKTFRAEYDESDKARFNPIVKRIEKSFKG
jgi:hypothetical protein